MMIPLRHLEEFRLDPDSEEARAQVEPLLDDRWVKDHPGYIKKCDEPECGIYYVKSGKVQCNACG